MVIVTFFSDTRNAPCSWRQDSLEGGGQTGAGPVGLLDTQSFLQQTFKYSHVPGIGWDGKMVGSTGNLGQSSKR